MRGLLFLVGILAVIGAAVLAFVPVTGENNIAVGPLDGPVSCGSVAAPRQARDEASLLERGVDAAFRATTSCDELLEERVAIVIFVGAGGIVAMGLAIAFTVVVGIVRGIARLFAPRSQ